MLHASIPLFLLFGHFQSEIGPSARENLHNFQRSDDCRETSVISLSPPSLANAGLTVFQAEFGIAAG
jgi:hypothetical protein